MAAIALKEWIPDAAVLGNPGAPVITNAIPALNSYQPMPRLVANTDALGARPRGAIEAVDKDGNVFQYAGDVDTLYQLSGTSWGDVSIAGGYSTGTEEVWEFTRWKEKILATNFSDSPQQITFGGTNFSDLTTALRGRHIAVVRDFVVFGNTFDASDGIVRDRVRWSAFNDETDYTVDPSTGADFRNLKSGGGIQRVIGGEYGVIVSERSTFRMTFTGAPTWFQIDETVPGIGAFAPGAVTTLGDRVYMLSEHGFIEIAGGASHRFIGAGKVDKFVRADIDQNNLHRMSAVADPRSGRVFWAYPGAGNTDGRPNKIVLYDVTLNKWGYIEQDVELIWRSGGVGTTLEQLDSVSSSIDTLGVSLDSSQWKGGAPQLSGFDSSFQNGNFSGAAMDATVETREVEFFSGHQSFVNGFIPLVDGGTVTGQIGARKRLNDEATFGSALSLRPSGRFTGRKKARYHRFRLNISGTWTDVMGIQVDREDVRRAGRRG